MKAFCFIQARLSSTRFPRKVLQEIWNGKNAIDLIIERLSPIFNENIVLTTTINHADDELVELYKDKIKIFRGSENDVFDRMTKAVAQYCSGGASTVVEITSDCPLICPNQIQKALETFQALDYDYLSNAIIRNFPIGFDFQIYEAWMLSALNYRIPNKNHKIHGGWNIANYSHILYCIAGKKINLRYGHCFADERYFHPAWRLTLDYKEDLQLLKEIYKRFDKVRFTMEDVVELILAEPELLDINKNCKQKVAGTDKL